MPRRIAKEISELFFFFFLFSCKTWIIKSEVNFCKLDFISRVGSFISSLIK